MEIGFSYIISRIFPYDGRGPIVPVTRVHATHNQELILTKYYFQRFLVGLQVQVLTTGMFLSFFWGNIIRKDEPSDRESR